MNLQRLRGVPMGAQHVWGAGFMLTHPDSQTGLGILHKSRKAQLDKYHKVKKGKKERGKKR